MSTEQWQVMKRTELLLRLIAEFSENSRMSLEGDFSGLRVLDIPGSSPEETAALRRNTTWPRQDFAIIPLTDLRPERLLSAMGGNFPSKILHVQIERGGRIEFAAYDNFHPECIVFGPGFRRELLDSLVAEGTIAKANQ